MELGLIAILINVAVIIGAVLTKRCFELMVAGSLFAAILLYGTSFMTEWSGAIQSVFAENVWIVLVCALFGGLISLLQYSKGSYGFSKLVAKFCTTEKRTLLTTFVMGILIFIDDYLNVLSIGVCMKNVYDKRKLPREALAYMLDATGAPVCVLLPFSTWAVFYAGLFYEQAGVAELGYGSGISTYIHAIPFSIYPIVTLIIVFLFAIGVFPKLGTMKKAYERVAETGKLYSDISRKYNHEEYSGYEEEGNIWYFIIPMVILVALTIITTDILMAVFVTLIVCFVIYIPKKVIKLEDFFTVLVKGICDMLPILTLLVVAFTFGKLTQEMQLTEYVIKVAEPLLSAKVFPMITFILVAILTFCTGNLWGMSAIVAPIVFPLGVALNANLLLIMAAIISGGAFGSHACFYTDATLMSSSSAGIDNLEHAVSQLPYVAIASVISIVGFLILGIAL